MDRKQAEAALAKAEQEHANLVAVAERMKAEIQSFQRETDQSLASAETVDLVKLAVKRASASTEVEARKIALEEIGRRIEAAQAPIVAARGELGRIAKAEVEKDTRRRIAEVVPVLADAVAKLQVIAAAWPPEKHERDSPDGVLWAGSVVNKVEQALRSGEKFLSS